MSRPETNTQIQIDAWLEIIDNARIEILKLWPTTAQYHGIARWEQACCKCAFPIRADIDGLWMTTGNGYHHQECETRSLT